MISRNMSLKEYERLTAEGKILEQQSFGVKVWLLPDQRIMKLFRLKRKLSSGRLYPYNLRFAHNARKTRKKGVAAPKILDCFYCPDLQRHGVIYELLAGDSFHDLFGPDTIETLMPKLAGFLGKLHEKGIYFRSVHPGNVLLMPKDQMGLIDIQDMRFLPFALPQSMRARNFRHLFNSDEHSRVMRQFGFERFVDLYLQRLPRPQSYRQRLKPKIMAFDKAWERKK